MNVALSAILLQTVKAITSGSFVDHLVDAVKSAASTTVSGAEKRAAVMAKLNDAKTDLFSAAKGIPQQLVNLALEVAVTYVTAHLKRI